MADRRAAAPACDARVGVIGLSTATWRYQRRGRVDNAAAAGAAAGARRGPRAVSAIDGCTCWSRAKACVANHKRVHRVYRDAGLQVRRRRRKRLTRGRARAAAGAEQPRRAVVDGLHGRHARGWPRLPDAEHRRRLHAGVRRDRGRSLAARARVSCACSTGCATTVGLPQAIVMDNGPEFAGRALDAWAYAHGVELRFIRPGKPIENAYVESFNGKFRDECLNEHWFVSLADAKAIDRGVARRLQHRPAARARSGSRRRRPTPSRLRGPQARVWGLLGGCSGYDRTSAQNSDGLSLSV